MNSELLDKRGKAPNGLSLQRLQAVGKILRISSLARSVVWPKVRRDMYSDR